MFLLLCHKSTKLYGITERNTEKFEIFRQNVWNVSELFLSLQRQKFTFGYPGKFPAREQDFIDTTPIFKRATQMSGSFNLSCISYNKCSKEFIIIESLTSY